MATTAVSSQGSQLAVKRSSTYDLIPYIKGFTLPENKTAYDDITNLDSAGGYTELLAIGFERTSISFDLVWNDDDHVHRFVENASVDRTLCDFQATLSNGKIAQFSAYIGWAPKAEARKALVVTVTLDVSGAVTYTN